MNVAISLYQPTDSRSGKKRNFVCQWADPITGKKVTRSTKTSIRRDAERFRARLAIEIEEGTFQRKKLSWNEFREKFERDVFPGKSKTTRNELRTTMKKLEELVSPARVDVLDSRTIMDFAQSLREQGRKEATVSKHLANIRQMLRWAKSEGIIKSVPEFKVRKVRGMKGRPITLEEFERMVEAVPKVIRDADEDSKWQFLLHGLWTSGLRVSEAVQLSWDQLDDIRIVDIDEKAKIDFASSVNKNRKDQTIPAAPEFAELLRSIPLERRKGRVFGFEIKRLTVSKRITSFGKHAGIIVSKLDGDRKYASAHDFRRSFGLRWANRVPAYVLQQIMRHEDIKTTLEFYVGQDADAAADIMYAAVANVSANASNMTPFSGQQKTAEPFEDSGVKKYTPEDSNL